MDTTTTQSKLPVFDGDSSRETKSKQTFRNRCLEKGHKLYLQSDSADVQFLFGLTDKTAAFVPAHKAILAGTSDVFAAMFYGKLKETGDIHVPDSNDAAFMEFLQYFYMADVTLTAANLVDVLYLGIKYDVKKCVDDCVQFLMRTVDVENVCGHLDLAILYDKKELLQICEQTILLDTLDVFDSTRFRRCSKRALEHILKMAVLSCTEIDIFKACMRWVQAKSGRAELSFELVEQYLGDLYYDIRLASLTIEEFCRLHTEYKSVLDRDFETITKMIVLPEYQVGKFNKCQRRATWNVDAIIKCARTPYSQDEEYDSDVDDDVDPFNPNDFAETIFSVDEPMLLGGFECHQILNENDVEDFDHEIELEVSEAPDQNGAHSKILSKMKIQFNPDGSTSVVLPQPVFIRPELFYTIHFSPFPPDCLFYCDFLNAKERLESDVTVTFHEDSSRSLIYELKFNKI